MSHWTRVKTKITEKDYLIKCLQTMGVELQQGNFTITQDGVTEKCQLRVDNAVGFSLQPDGTWAMIGDPYYSNNAVIKSAYRKEEDFNKRLTTQYSVIKAKEKFTELDWYCAENEQAEIGEDGLITMVFRSDY